MRVIIDANQLVAVAAAEGLNRAHRRSFILVLPMGVLAECVHRERHLAALAMLPERYRLAFAKEPAVFLPELPLMRKSDVPSAKPFYPKNSSERRRLLNRLSSQEIKDVRSESAKIREHHLRCQRELRKAMIVKRRKARGAPRSETISDLVSLKEDRAQAALKAWIREWLLRVYEDSRAKRMSSDDFFLAASKNRHVVNYLTFEFAFAASYGHCWRDDNLNFDPPERTNDTVDISLALSLTKGDVLLTADQKLTSMCRLASDEWDVFTWSDWVSRGH